MKTKIAVSGIGGVGGYYGGLLAAHYKHADEISIYFVARGENLKVIRKKGLQINTPSATQQSHPVLATDDPKQIGVVDYLFCCTKSYDLEENIRQLSPLIGPATVILPLLNGADITERIQKILPDHEVWMGCVYIGARLSAPGIITKFTVKDKFWFGSPDGSPAKQKALLKILTDAGIDAVNPEDIATRIWKKFFMISLGATTTSYYNQSIGNVMQFHTNTFRQLAAELKAVADAKGILLPDNMADKVIEDQKMMPYDSTTSMHTDFKNGKHTELESLTGYVIRTGKALHVPTPLYERMYAKLKEKA